MTNERTSKQTGQTELIAAIREQIAQSPSGVLTFQQFMRLCLYHPEFGYYTRAGDTEAVGKSGDFYTSASIGTVLADVLAAFAVKELNARAPSSGPIRIVEWGGGTGRLAADMLDRLLLLDPKLYSRLHWLPVEISPTLREKQGHTIAAAGHADVLQEPERESVYTFVYANELLDAFPVRRIRKRNGDLYECCVGWDEAEGRFVERELPIQEQIGVAAMLSDGQTAELNPEATAWVEELGDQLRTSGVRATVWLADYGDRTAELTAPHRMNGTLLCYYKHQAMDAPLERVGEQDMTSHVDFDEIEAAAVRAGFEERSLLTQKQFLVENGVLELLVNRTDGDPFSADARRNRSIRQLLLSDGMSELFKVCILRMNP